MNSRRITKRQKVLIVFRAVNCPCGNMLLSNIWRRVRIPLGVDLLGSSEFNPEGASARTWSLPRDALYAFASCGRVARCYPISGAGNTPQKVGRPARQRWMRVRPACLRRFPGRSDLLTARFHALNLRKRGLRISLWPDQIILVNG